MCFVYRRLSTGYRDLCCYSRLNEVHFPGTVLAFGPLMLSWLTSVSKNKFRIYTVVFQKEQVLRGTGNSQKVVSINNVVPN